jgi:hypothetical protein
MKPLACKGWLSPIFLSAARLREYRHLFSAHRRIVATIRVDIARLRFRPGDWACFRCEWDGSKVKQPSADLYQEFKVWADTVFSDVADQAGHGFLYVFEVPETQRVEVWHYDPGCAPRLAKVLANPFDRPLAEVLCGMPAESWDDEP